MTPVLHDITEAVEGRVVRYAERPIPFERFLDISTNPNLELVDGVTVERMAANLKHERLFVWLVTMLNLYVNTRDLGIVLGSRTAVEISEFGGRLPDILFVRRDRMGVVQERAVYGAPDLVIELVSPNDRPSDVISLETDYRSVGVSEIVFINQSKRSVVVLRKRDGRYEDHTLTSGTLHLETVDGFEIEAEWLWQEPRPDELGTVTRLLSR